MWRPRAGWVRARRLPGVAGRIRDDDIAEVREKARIDDVVSQYVTLKRAGGGSLKGLCPFHDEKTPSFNVNPARQFFHCFGCGEGGDVIAFVMKVDGLTFTETVERLAEKFGVQLRREEGDDEPVRPRGPARGRLIEAHKVAQEFYAEQLGVRRCRGRASVPRPARLRPGRRRDVRRRVRAARRRGADPPPARSPVHRRGVRRRRPGRPRPVPLRPVPRSSGLADPRGQRRHDRLRRASHLRRRPHRGEVPQHLRDRDLQEEPRPLRHRPGPHRDEGRPAGRRGRGLHRRDGLPPRRRDDRGGVVRHGVRHRPRAGAAALPRRPRHHQRRGHLHLRRRLGRAEGGDEGARERPGVRLADLRRGRARGHGPVRPPDQGGRRGRARARRQAPAALPLRPRQHPHPPRPRPRRRSRSTPCATRPVWSPSIRDKTKVESFSRELAHMVGVDVDEVRGEVRRAASRPAKHRTSGVRPARPRCPRQPEPARPALPEPVRPALPHRARAAQARHPAPGRGRAAPPPTSRRPTSPTRPSRACGRP